MVMAEPPPAPPPRPVTPPAAMHDAPDGEDEMAAAMREIQAEQMPDMSADPPLAALDHAPPLVPEQPEAPARPRTRAGNVEALAARRARPWRPRSRERDPKSMALAFLVVTLASALLALGFYREQVVRLVPDAAEIYAAIGMPVNLRGLEIGALSTTRDVQDGVIVLSVEGTITNVTQTRLAVPRLRLIVLDDKQVEIYAWTAQPPQSHLEPRECVAFRSRLAAPPPEGRRVLVRFLTKQDISGTAP